MNARLIGIVFCTILLGLPHLPAAYGQAAQIRLRARSFVPSPNVVEPRVPTTFNRAGVPDAPDARRHVLIQFSRPIDAAILADVRRAGGTPLRYVPDNAISAAVTGTFDPYSIAGALWMGELEPIDRVSAETARDLGNAFPSHPLTVIEFHPDVERSTIARVLAGAGATMLDLPALPQYAAVIPTDERVIEQLARHDATAWIYPAPHDVDSMPAAVCDGVVRPEGIVANYAAMGDGWDGPGRGSARLGYVLSTTSADLPPDAALRELTRAMAEWSRHAAIAWEPGQGRDDTTSVHIFWGPTFHGDGFPFATGVLAHAFYPAPPVIEPVAGDVHFNDTYLWGASDPRRWDIFSVALHELGHSLGLAHSGDPESVMYPMYRGIVPGLAPGDIETLRLLYADAFPEPLPGGWATLAIGRNPTGTASEAGGRFTVSASGRDIWDTADEFRFVYQPLHGNGDIIARVDSLNGTHRWSKAGVMLRASNASGSAHAMALVSRSRGIAFQRRQELNGVSVHTEGGAGAAPAWLWLSRRGHRIEAYAASDGGDWRLIGADTIDLGSDVLAGLAVTNHDVAGLATAVFSHVSIVSLHNERWTAADIGAVGKTGSWVTSGTRFHVRGAGDDVWDRADAFHFVWQTIDGDGEIVARLLSVTQTRSWAKAGVMIRGGLERGAAHAFMLGSAAKGRAFQRRPAAGGLSVHTSAGPGSAPVWLKLTRRGNRVDAYRSDDGKEWILVDSAVIQLGRIAFVGLAVSSHTARATCDALFDQVAVIGQ